MKAEERLTEISKVAIRAWEEVDRLREENDRLRSAKAVGVLPENAENERIKYELMRKDGQLANIRKLAIRADDYRSKSALYEFVAQVLAITQE